MLVQFSIENYTSIKEKITFSMLASADKELPENLIEWKNEKYLKSAVIYGANASGKSKIFDAINNVIFMIANSNSIQPGNALPIVPFKFDEEYMRNIYIIIQMAEKQRFLKEQRLINTIIHQQNEN